MTQLIQTIVLGLLLGGVYALLASGLTLIFGVMDVINVAQGALMILAAFMTWAISNETELDPLLGVLVTTPAMFLIGFGLYMARHPLDPGETGCHVGDPHVRVWRSSSKA